jgi:hypothetical protein
MRVAWDFGTGLLVSISALVTKSPLRIVSLITFEKWRKLGQDS